MFMQYLPLIVCLVGLLVYLYATSPAAQQNPNRVRLVMLGEKMFFAGLLAFLLINGNRLPVAGH